MSPNQVIYVHMAHPNTTKYKSPWSYPLSTPVEGVDDGSLLVNCGEGGFDGTGGPEASESHQKLGGAISYVLECGGRFQEQT